LAVKIRNKKGGRLMVYFISNLHFGHPEIIGMQNRPFENAEEANE